MKILLDTHILLWWLMDDSALTTVGRESISDAANTVYVSAASTWEIALKKSLGKLQMPDDLEEVLEQQGFDILNISVAHSLAVEHLPFHHRDPFDRMLIAQAQMEQLIVFTHDKEFEKYDISLQMIK